MCLISTIFLPFRLTVLRVGFPNKILESESNVSSTINASALYVLHILFTFFHLSGGGNDAVPVPLSSKSPIFLVTYLSEFSKIETNPSTQYFDPILSVPIPSPVTNPSIILPARFFFVGTDLLATTTFFIS